LKRSVTPEIAALHHLPVHYEYARGQLTVANDTICGWRLTTRRIVDEQDALIEIIFSIMKVFIIAAATVIVGANTCMNSMTVIFRSSCIQVEQPTSGARRSLYTAPFGIVVTLVR
jgi:hypothetical protein